MSSQSSSRGVGVFSCSDYEKVKRVKYTEPRTFSLSEQKKRVNPSTTTLAIRVVTEMSNGNVLERWHVHCDSSEEEDDPEYYDSSSDESGKSAHRQSTSEEEDAFFLFL